MCKDNAVTWNRVPYKTYHICSLELPLKGFDQQVLTSVTLACHAVDT